MTKKHQIGYAVLLCIGFGVEGVVAPVPVQQVKVVTGVNVVTTTKMSPALEISPALNRPMPFAAPIPGESLLRRTRKP